MPSSAHVTTEPGWSDLAAPEELGRIGDADEPRRRSSRRLRARWSSRSGSSPPAGCGGLGSGRPRTAGRSQRGARARAGLRRRHPSSRARPERSRRHTPLRRGAGGPSPRGPGLRSRPRSRALERRGSGSSRSRIRPERSRSSVAETMSRSVSARMRTSPAPPRRSARSFTCAADSSPVTRATVRSALIARNAMSNSVDLPMPGSPLTRTSDAGTRPPPSTRSSSATPVGRRSASVASTSSSRSSGLDAAACAGPLPLRDGAASSRSVPQPSQLGHRPSQRPVT